MKEVLKNEAKIFPLLHAAMAENLPKRLPAVHHSHLHFPGNPDLFLSNHIRRPAAGPANTNSRRIPS
jgi:hypothetical protein